MLKFILISIFSFLFGMLSIIFISIFKISSKCSNKEENIDNWYKRGQDVYDEIAKKEKNKKV